jgi:tetratricopeptide (TPR) repeat protein/TolB-like protein/tRNA A-37 threonylcarbamoyl transferase component Bud32
MAEVKVQRDARGHPESDLTGRTIGRFLIGTRLGGGGMGDVYLADDTGLKRRVAVKRMAAAMRSDSHSRERLWKEAERASRLNDPHVAAVYDVVEDGDEVFLVMEYVEGETLRRRLGRPFPVGEFLPVALQCASALAAAHKAGLVHRDIKPENIMLTPTGEVKTLDFGVSRELPGAETAVTLESLESAGFQGTHAYMAPEILEEKRADARADIFSLGVVFYEALAGKNPFRRGSFLGTCDAILHHFPPPLSEENVEVSAELERIVTKMLAKKPDDRYATAADLVVDLRAAQREHEALTRTPQLAHEGPVRSGRSLPTEVASEAVKPARKRPFRAAGMVALVVIAAIAAIVAIPSVRGRVRGWLGIRSVPQRKYVAVLQFRAVQSDPQAASFTAGLSDTLTAKLTQLTAGGSLQVVPAAEIQSRHVATVEEARSEFGVNLVIDGSLAKAGDLVRVNCALVDPRTRRQLRADTITVAAANAFAVQDEVVNGVVSMLELEVQPDQRAALATHGTQVPAAYSAYLQGTGYLDNYDRPENLDRAIGDFQQALQLDPNYALAYAGLGSAYWKKYENSKDTQWVAKSRESCQRSLTVDDKIAAGHLCLGTIDAGTGSYENAVAEFELALKAEPTNDSAYRGLGFAYEHLGKLTEAEKTYQRAIALRPEYWAGYSWLGAFYYNQARYEEAAKAFQRVVDLAPDNLRGHYNLGATLNELGRYDDAIQTLKQSIAIQPTAGAYSNLGISYFYSKRFVESVGPYEKAVKIEPGDDRLWWNLGDAYHWAPARSADAPAAYRHAISLAAQALKVNPRDTQAQRISAVSSAMLGERAEALASLRDALKTGPVNPDTLFAAALVYNQVGSEAETVQWLEKARAAGISATKIRDTPAFDHLHQDPRFRKLSEGQ